MAFRETCCDVETVEQDRWMEPIVDTTEKNVIFPGQIRMSFLTE